MNADRSTSRITSLRRGWSPRTWSLRSLALIILAWLILQLGGLFSPGLLDDVDSVYIQIAREMLARHDFITPTIDGIRFFDKPPLLYWLAAGSMHLFGIHDWAARLPLALGVLALLLAVYALGVRLYADFSPTAAPDRAALYAALATATSLGPYLYTRFFIPDILIALWMTLSVHLFLSARDRALAQAAAPQPAAQQAAAQQAAAQQPGGPFTAELHPVVSGRAGRAGRAKWRALPHSPLVPSLAFGAVLALDVLTKGLIGLVFPLAFVFLFLLLRRELPLLRKLHILPAAAIFLLLAVPWHLLVALRNPAIPIPAGTGLPPHAGWAWFYLYNEHIARFLGRRIPQDYGQVPIPLFWLLLGVWLIPWAAFLPGALRNAFDALRSSRTSSLQNAAFRGLSSQPPGHETGISTRARGAEWADPCTSPAGVENASESTAPTKPADATLATLLWPGIILGFFTLSSRQEYYHLPALPALALLVGALLAAADRRAPVSDLAAASQPDRQALAASAFFLVPLGCVLFIICGYLALSAHAPSSGLDLYAVLNNDPAHYNLSLGHLFDLTGAAMGFFRGPLLTVALGMLVLGPLQHGLRRGRRTYAANLAVAAAMVAILLAAHEGLTRFYPILGSKGLALSIREQLRPGDLVAIDGELTSGSTLLFYTDRPVLLVNGRVNGPWFGSFWPDAPHVFLNEAALRTLWSGPRRVFLLTYDPRRRSADLGPLGPVRTLSTAGGKTVLTNRP